jgi:hypothetical protein
MRNVVPLPHVALEINAPAVITNDALYDHQPKAACLFFFVV